MLEDLNRIWKIKEIRRKRGAKLSRLWRRNGRKIKGIWKTRGTKLRRMHLEKLNKRKENGKRTQMKKAQTSRVKQGSSNNKQEIRSLSVRATNQASRKNAQISRNFANQQKGYSRSQQTSITSTRWIFLWVHIVLMSIVGFSVLSN